MMEQADGTPSGIAVEAARRAFDRAGLRVKWQNAPFSRCMKMLSDDGEPLCIAALYRTPERAKIAKFSKVLSRDSGYVLSTAPVGKILHLSELPKGKALHFLMKAGNSYGREIDDFVAKGSTSIIVTTVETTQMAKMIREQRADGMFATVEEADYLLHQDNSLAPLVTLVPIADAAIGRARYILCSRSTPDAVLGAINEAIDALDEDR